MGLQTKPAYIGTAGFQNPVENDRNLLEYVFHRQGVIRKESFVAASVAGAMQLNVSAGAGVLLGSASTQGGYFGYSDAAENIPWPASNGSNPRIDSLLMRVIDTQYGADAAGDLLRWEVVSGTAAASPVALTDAQINSSFPHPGSWMRMYDVRVPAAVTNLTTATITRKFPYVNSMGVLLYASAVESRPAGLFYGERLVDITTGLEYWWDGAVWVQRGGQSLFSWNRGAGLTLNNKIIGPVTGQQSVYTTPAIAVEPSTQYLISWSLVMGSGVAGQHWFKSYIYVNGVLAGRSGEFSYSGGNVPERSGGHSIPYHTAPGTTSITIEVKSDDGSALTYDVYADPDQQAYLHVIASGRKTSQVNN